jgi:hypothetical protein
MQEKKKKKIKTVAYTAMVFASVKHSKDPPLERKGTKKTTSVPRPLF